MVSSIARDEQHRVGHGCRRVLGLTGMCLGTVLIVMEANVVNVAVPTIRTDLGAGPATALWAVDAYTLVLAVLLLSAGDSETASALAVAT